MFFFFYKVFVCFYTCPLTRRTFKAKMAPTWINVSQISHPPQIRCVSKCFHQQYQHLPIAQSTSISLIILLPLILSPHLSSQKGFTHSARPQLLLWSCGAFSFVAIECSQMIETFIKPRQPLMNSAACFKHATVHTHTAVSLLVCRVAVLCWGSNVPGISLK